MTLPSFLVLGAQKAGTTSIYDYLAQHPDIFMSPVKEPHFFTYLNVEAPRSSPEEHSRFYRPLQPIAQLEDYERLFEGAGGRTIRGEASPSYIYGPAAPQNIRDIVPDAKLIVILRNPVDRAFSNYQMNRRSGQELLTTFEDAIAAEECRIAEGWGFAWHYLAKGRYAEQLRRYLGVFPADQLKIMLFDDLIADPTSFMRDVYTFVGADSGFVPNVEHSSNVSGVPKNRALSLVLRPAQLTHRWWSPFVPIAVRHRVRSATLTRERMLSDTRSRLLAQFDAEITDLGRLIGRDLSSWRR